MARDDVAAMGEAIECGAGQSLAAQDFDPLLEGQVGGDDEAGTFIGGADHVEEELGAELTGRDISELIENQQIELGPLTFQARQGSFLAGLHELGDELGHPPEADFLSPAAGFDSRRRGLVRLAGSGVSDQPGVFPDVDVVATHELGEEHPSNRRLGGEVERFQRFVGGEADGFESPLRGPTFPVKEFHLAELVGPTGKGGKIREELAASGADRRAEVLAEAYKWVGHPQSKEPGALNASPWNVPIGAP